MMIKFSVLFFLALAVAAASSGGAATVNNRPILGILTLPCYEDAYCQGHAAYFPASYVKWIESAGARVVPVDYRWDADKLEETLGSLNGFLFTGGGASLAPTSEYFAAVQHVYDWVVQTNKAGTHFPLWGTCLGFQSIVRAQSQDPTILTAFNAENYTIPLNFTSFAAQGKSRMFPFTSQGTTIPGAKHAFGILGADKVTMNNHHWGVSPANFANHSALSSFFDVLSTNVDEDGLEFVSLIEAKTMPIYGAQFHPEKNIFEWWPEEVMQHSADAIFPMQYLANFLVSESRKNDNKFPTVQDETRALIYNYQPYFANTYFVQVYLFA